MFKAFPTKYQAILLGLIGYSSFSFADAAAKWLGQSLPPEQTVSLIQGGAALLLLALSPWLGGLKSLWDQDARINAKAHLFRGILNGSINFLIVYAFAQLPLVTVYTAVFTMPFMAAFLAIPLFGQAIGWHRGVAISAAFVGVLIAFEPWTQNFPLSMSLVLIALPLVIALMFMAARWMKGGSLLALAFWPIFCSFLINTALALHSGWVAFDPALLPIAVGTGAFCIIGVIGVSYAFQIGDSALVSPLVYIEMIWGILLGYALFSDIPSTHMLIGSAVIIFSGIYLIMREGKDAY